MVKKNVNRFTVEGVEAFAEHIEQKRDNKSKRMPNLAKADLIESFGDPKISFTIEVPSKKLSKAELSDIILGFFNAHKIDITTTYGDQGLWAYLTYLFFDKHLSKAGHKPVVTDKYILSEGSWGYYRHALSAMCWIRELHGKDVGRVLMLSPDTHTFGDSLEQILASPLYQSKQIFELLDDLYLIDDGKGNLSRSPTFLNQNNTKANLRQFKRSIGRLNMTYHLPSLTVGRLKAMLPLQFREWGTIEDDTMGLPKLAKDPLVGSKKTNIP